MKEEKNRSERPEAYPKPTETDNQLNNQPEYIDQEPNSYEKDISDVSVKRNREQEKDESLDS